MKPNINPLLEQLAPELDALTKQAKELSRLTQQILYGKDFVSGQDSVALTNDLKIVLGDFFEETLDPGRGSMRYAPDGKGGYIR
jgi:hypothetical protein